MKEELVQLLETFRWQLEQTGRKRVLGGEPFVIEYVEQHFNLKEFFEWLRHQP